MQKEGFHSHRISWGGASNYVMENETFGQGQGNSKTVMEVMDSAHMISSSFNFLETLDHCPGFYHLYYALFSFVKIR